MITLLQSIAIRPDITIRLLNYKSPWYEWTMDALCPVAKMLIRPFVGQW